MELSEIKLLTIIPILISGISFLVSFVSYWNTRLNRIEDKKKVVYEKLLETAYLAEMNVQLLNDADKKVKRLFPDGSESFEEQKIKAHHLKQATQEQIKEVRELKVGNRKSLSETYSAYYFQIGELYVATKVLNDAISNGNSSLDEHIKRKYG